jgi:phage terminase large subunit-like protein
MRANIPVMRFDPGKHGDKVGRCRIASQLIENGLVWLPTEYPKHEFYTADSEMFIDAAVTFPNAESNDIIDSMSQAFIRLTSTGWLLNKEDPINDTEPAWKKEQRKYW